MPKRISKQNKDAKEQPRKGVGKEPSNAVSHVDVAREHLRKMRQIHPRLLAAERIVAVGKEKWIDNKDSKSLAANEQTLADLKKEAAFIRQSARALLGNRPIRFWTPMSLTITTAVTTGITNTVTLGGGTAAITPQNMAEWSSFQALFDEIKIHAGVCDFVYSNPYILAATYGTSDALAVIGYDTSDSTAITSTLAGCQLAQHKTLDNGIAGTGGQAIASSTGLSTGVHHKFSFVVPKGTYSDPAGSFCGDIWQPTTSGATAVGAIKFFHVGGVITAIVTGAGVLMLDISLRCRS
jgi:hypothetical protein